MTGTPNRSYAHRRWLLIGYWAFIFLLTHWPEIDRFGPDLGLPHSDKLGHAAIYAGWAFMWWWVLTAGGRVMSAAAANWLALGGLLYAVFDEATQSIVDRTPALGDLAANLVGLICAISVLQWWQRRRQPKRA